MEKVTTITSEDDGEKKFPRLGVALTHAASSVDLKVVDESGNQIGAAALDYFDGKLRVLVWLPEDEEPSHNIQIRDFQKTGAAQ